MIWRLSRIGLFILAALLIVHGFVGPDFAPKNLTTIFVWVHYRGLLILTALLFGNFFCGACPGVFLRNVIRRFHSPRKRWPHFLRNKWLATGLFATVLFAYERWALWGSPVATATLILIFFVGIVTVDLIFKDASFCQFVCPVGQFNFLAAIISPRSVQARDLSACESCQTLDCIRGNEFARGCELKLFVPKKMGNMNCTFCMDCVQACPKKNITLQKMIPGEGLFDLRGQWLRGDMIALQIVFIFGAMVNAFAMTPFAEETKNILAQWGGISNPTAALIMVFVLFMGLLPAAFMFVSHLWCRLAKAGSISNRQFWPALLPLGVAVWTAHYLFHFLTGPLTFLPVAWRILRLPELPLGTWARVPMGFPVAVVEPMQLGVLGLGLFLTWVTLHARAKKISPTRPLIVQIPWIISSLLFAVMAAWILTAPMAMRGTFVGS